MAFQIRERPSTATKAHQTTSLLVGIERRSVNEKLTYKTCRWPPLGKPDIFSADPSMRFDLKQLIATRTGENYTLHAQHVNSTLVKVQRTIGFDVVYTRAEGAYLYDREGNDYLDFLSGYSAFNIGRNHPVVKQALHDVLDLDLPNMVQMDCSLLSGLLAEALVQRAPAHLDAVFFTNSGTESVEGAMKFAKAATKRQRFVSFHGGFHGLSCGSLSLMGNPAFREGFGELLPGCVQLASGDRRALARELQTRDVAAVVIEPVQGKGVHSPGDDFFNYVQEQCRSTGTLLISDEVQTGLGRTGRFFGFQHRDLEPDIVTLAKSLSGGYVPCGAILTRRWIYQSVFNRLDRCVAHSSTFGRNNLAMTCGLATLSVIESEDLVARAEFFGALLASRLRSLQDKHPLIKEVRGKGLMLAIEFQEPPAAGARTMWKFLHRVDGSLFTQMIVTRLFMRHRILTQVAAHECDILKILPPLIIGEAEIDRFVQALDESLTSATGFPGPMLDMGKNFLARKFS